MKKLITSFGWMLLLLPFISIASVRTAITNSDTETRPVEPFTAIASSGSFDLFITMGSAESLKLEGDSETLKKVETVVENGTLKIRFQHPTSFKWKKGDVKVYITAKTLNTLISAGSGTMKVEGTIKADKFNAVVSGSGSITTTLDVTNYIAKISGSGKITVSGKVEMANIAVSGSGDFFGETLNTNDANIQVSGSGNVSIHAENTLNVSVSGSGDITYSGNAKLTSSTSGSGRISKL